MKFSVGKGQTTGKIGKQIYLIGVLKDMNGILTGERELLS